jgi:hypothetical protein
MAGDPLRDVLGESTVQGHAASVEVLAEQGLSAAAVEAIIALFGP